MHESWKKYAGGVVQIRVSQNWMSDRGDGYVKIKLNIFLCGSIYILKIVQDLLVRHDPVWILLPWYVEVSVG